MVKYQLHGLIKKKMKKKTVHLIFLCCKVTVGHDFICSPKKWIIIVYLDKTMVVYMYHRSDNM